MQRLKNVAMILVGNLMITLALGQVVLANGFIAGGVTGFSLVLQHFVPVEIALLTGVINTLLFVMGALVLGRGFAVSTALSALTFPFFLKWCTMFTLFPELERDFFFASILAGCFIGVGVGLIIRSGGSTGGVDIIPLVINKYTGIPVARCLMVVDVSIIALQLIWARGANTLYGLLIVVLTSYVVNQTLAYGQARIQLITISEHYEEIRQAVLHDCDTGVTMLHVETGYTAQDQKALLMVVPYKLLLEVKQTILRIDPHAFVIISNTRDVNGRGYSMER